MDPTFWDKAFPVAVGAAIGGFATIAAIALKEWLDSRKAIQEWYEEVYIFDGVSQLIVYLSSVEDLLTTLEAKNPVPSDLFEPYPRNALERFIKLFPDCGYAIRLLQVIRGEVAKTRDNRDPDEKGVKYALNLTAKLKTTLTALEKELLGISIVRKRQVYEIRDNRKIKSVLAQLEQKPPAPKSS